MAEDRSPIGDADRGAARRTDDPSPALPPGPASRLRQARRRRSRRLVAAIGAIIAVLLLSFVALYLATAPRTLAERTFHPPNGDEIAARIVEQGDRVTARVEVSGPDLNATAMMSIDFPHVDGTSRRARIDYDAEASEVLLQVEKAKIRVEIGRAVGGIAFNPVIQPTPQPRPAP